MEAEDSPHPAEMYGEGKVMLGFAILLLQIMAAGDAATTTEDTARLPSDEWHACVRWSDQIQRDGGVLESLPNSLGPDVPLELPLIKTAGDNDYICTEQAGAPRDEENARFRMVSVGDSALVWPVD